MTIQTNPHPVRFIGNQFETKGFVGDLANAFKLTNFWTESLYGATSDLSGRITNAGTLFKNYLDAISVPAAAADIGRDWELLDGREILNDRGQPVRRHLDGPVRRVAEFVSSNLSFLKNLFGAGELVNKVWGEEFMSKETLKQYSSISGAATLAFAGNQVVFENGPELVTQVSAGNAGKATSAFLKLVKHVSLAAVGALALIAAFYAPIPAIAIPVLLTVALIASVVGRFFDGLVLAPAPRGPVQAAPANIMTQIREIRDQITTSLNESRDAAAQQFAGFSTVLNERLTALQPLVVE